MADIDKSLPNEIRTEVEIPAEGRSCRRGSSRTRSRRSYT
jgi:hypothetical protein